MGAGAGWQEGTGVGGSGTSGRGTGQHLLRLHVSFPEAQHTLLQDPVTQLNPGSVRTTAHSSIIYKSKRKLAFCNRGYRQGSE